MLYLEEALLQSDRSAEAQQRSKLVALWQRVQEELERNWQLDELAAIANVSVSTFQRQIRKLCRKQSYRSSHRVVSLTMNRFKNSNGAL